MSEFSDTSKKVVAGALAGTVAVVGGVGLSQQAKKINLKIQQRLQV